MPALDPAELVDLDFVVSLAVQASSSDLFKLVRYGRSTTRPAGQGPKAS